MGAGITPPEARSRSSFDAEGAVSNCGRSVTLSDSMSENMIGSGGLYGFVSTRREGMDKSDSESCPAKVNFW